MDEFQSIPEDDFIEEIDLLLYGMRDYINSVDESTFDEKISTVQYPHEERSRGSRFIGNMEKTQRSNTCNVSIKNLKI